MGATPATFGVDLGGTNLRVALVDPDGPIVDEHRMRHAPTRSTASSTHITGAVRTPRAAAARRAVRSASAPPGMVDRDGMIHYSPNVPAFRRRRCGRGSRRRSACRRSSTTTPTSRSSAELVHGAARGCDEVLLDHARHRRRRRDRHRRRGAAGRARLRRRDRALPGRSRRPDVRVRPAGPLGGASRRAPRSGALGRARAAAGAAPSVLELGARASPTTSTARWWVTPPRPASPTRSRSSRSTPGTSRSASSAW